MSSWLNNRENQFQCRPSKPLQMVFSGKAYESSCDNIQYYQRAKHWMTPFVEGTNKYTCTSKQTRYFASISSKWYRILQNWMSKMWRSHATYLWEALQGECWTLQSESPAVNRTIRAWHSPQQTSQQGCSATNDTAGVWSIMTLVTSFSTL